jgi:2,4-dienoyl-CoA reductase-like NADH-dependent reductase (Old Yellow Enzyme family)
LTELVRRIRGAGEGKVIPQVIDFLKIARRDPARSLARLERSYPGCSSWSEEELHARLGPREWDDHARGYRQRIEDLDVAEIEALPGLFADAARRARQCGFDGVELHFAHAYTMSSFLSRTNARTDDYGGSLENRARICLAAIEAVRREVGTDFCVGLRLLGSDDILRDDGSIAGSPLCDAAWFGARFAEAGADFISVSRGGRFEDAKRPGVGEAAYPYTGHSGLMCMPTFKWAAANNLHLPSGIRKAVWEAGCRTPVVGAGRINTYEVAESALRQGHCDLVGMARGLLSDPDWPRKVRAGRAADVHYCKYNNVCEALDRKHLPVRCQLWMKLEKGGMHPPDEW